jgi:addiction module HigA family antidote
MHPGRILLEDYLAPRGISVWHLAKDIGVPVRRLYEIVQGQRPITQELALRLAHYFGLSRRFWLELQARYDEQQEQATMPPKVIDLTKRKKPKLFTHRFDG